MPGTRVVASLWFLWGLLPVQCLYLVHISLGKCKSLVAWGLLKQLWCYMSIVLPFALTSLSILPSWYPLSITLVSTWYHLGPVSSPHKIIPRLQLLYTFPDSSVMSPADLELGPVDEREHMVSVSWLPHSILSLLVRFTSLKFSLQLSNIPVCIVPHVHYLLFRGRALGCFHFLVVVNRAARGIAQQASVKYKAKSFGSMTRRTTVGSYSNCICSFWEFSSLFSGVAASVFSPTNNEWGFLFLHSRLLILITLTKVRWNLKVDSVCIRLIGKGNECFLRSSLVTLCSSIVDVLFRFPTHF